MLKTARVKLLSLLLALALLLGASPAALAAPEPAEPFDPSFGGAFETTLDLREKGYVTPVKKQNPWSSCWAFGGIAAAETSILSMMDKKGEALDPKSFDLSEKHLIWFASRPITASAAPTQAGDGLYMMQDDPTYAYTLGGFGFFVTSLFASGVGPVAEELFPYRGSEGLTQRQFFKVYRDVGMQAARDAIEETIGITLEEALSNPNEMATRVINKMYERGFLDESVPLTIDVFEEAAYQYYLAVATDVTSYIGTDDWSIPELNGEGEPNRNVSSGFTMTDGNLLPDMTLKDGEGHWIGINPEGFYAVKSELSKGRGVSFSFMADQATPGDPITDDSYLNTETWAQYTHNDVGTNHVVCIVGWDDSYSKENFNEGLQPPGDGAWLVKNSWGSETDFLDLGEDAQINKGDWGITDSEGRHTGYFWLSYYDKSIRNCESMSFDTELYDTGGSLDVWAYDYMPSMIRADSDPAIQSDSLVKTANVFENTLGVDARLYSVSTSTASPGATVRYSVYKLNDDAHDPEDGELLCTKDATYEYAGFHRESLNGDITVAAGEKISVVAEESVTDETAGTIYEFVLNAGLTKARAEQIDEIVYCNAVVNPGESFLYENGAWGDLSEDATKASIYEVFEKGQYAIDNFSIKAYMIYDEEETPAALWDYVSTADTLTLNALPGGKPVFASFTDKDGRTIAIKALKAGVAVSIPETAVKIKLIALGAGSLPFMKPLTLVSPFSPGGGLIIEGAGYWSPVF